MPIPMAQAALLSEHSIRRIRATLQTLVDDGVVPGVAMLLDVNGVNHCFEHGTNAFNGSAPMTAQTICRLTSMTKPISAVAALRLVDQGQISLDDPVDGLIPELANRRVLRNAAGPLDDTVTAARPITLRDLLACTMGFGIRPGLTSAAPIVAAVEAMGVMTLGPPQPPVRLPPDSWMARLGQLPLMSQPGAEWLYNTSFSVLGVLLSRLSGQSLDNCLREQVLEPLGMSDTAFWIPPAARSRTSACYMDSPATGSLTLVDPAEHGGWSASPVFPSASGGLVSTAADYLVFAKALLASEEGSSPLLSAPTLAEMTRDQLFPHQKQASPFAFDFWDALGWGLGVSVVSGARRDGPGAHSYGWEGAFGNFWLTDPARKLVLVLMCQRAFSDGTTPLQRTVLQAVFAELDQGSRNDLG